VSDQTFTYEIVTPEQAAAWLANPHVHQRRTPLTAASKAAQYAAVMAGGGWDPNVPQGIFLTEDEQLINGGNRLNAVILAGVPVRLLVVRNVPPEVFDVIDVGRARAPGQFVDNGNDAAAIARWLLWYETRFDSRPSSVAMAFPLRDVVTYVTDHEDEIDQTVADARAIRRSAGLPVAIHGAVLALARRGGDAHLEGQEDHVDRWLDGLRTGAGLGEGDPRLTLRNRFLARLGKRNAGSVLADWSIITAGWNAFSVGETLAQSTGSRIRDTWPRVGEDADAYRRRSNAESSRRHAARIRANAVLRAAKNAKAREYYRARRGAADAAVVDELVNKNGLTLPDAMAAVAPSPAPDPTRREPGGIAASL
jgi:hypothetical protein